MSGMQVVFSLTLYKVMSLLVGTVFSYMGYRLFLAGIWGDAGTFKAEHDNSALVLKNAAPGTFFALLGAAIVLLTLWKGMELESSVVPAATTQSHEVTIPFTSEREEDLPDDPPF